MSGAAFDKLRLNGCGSSSCFITYARFSSTPGAYLGLTTLI